jgi:hypothetical protein
MAAATTSDEQPSGAQLAPNEKFFRYFQHEVTGTTTILDSVHTLNAHELF